MLQKYSNPSLFALAGGGGWRCFGVITTQQRNVQITSPQSLHRFRATEVVLISEESGETARGKWTVGGWVGGVLEGEGGGVGIKGDIMDAKADFSIMNKFLV